MGASVGSLIHCSSRWVQANENTPSAMLVLPMFHFGEPIRGPLGALILAPAACIADSPGLTRIEAGSHNPDAFAPPF